MLFLLIFEDCKFTTSVVKVWKIFLLYKKADGEMMTQCDTLFSEETDLTDDFRLDPSLRECLICNGTILSTSVIRFHRNVARCSKFWRENSEAKKKLISRCLISGKTAPMKSSIVLEEFCQNFIKSISCKICVWAHKNVLDSDLNDVELFHHQIENCYRIQKRQHFDNKRKSKLHSSTTRLEAEIKLRKCENETEVQKYDTNKSSIEGLSTEEGHDDGAIENISYIKLNLPEDFSRNVCPEKRKSESGHSGHVDISPSAKKIKASTLNDDVQPLNEDTSNACNSSTKLDIANAIINETANVSSDDKDKYVADIFKHQITDKINIEQRFQVLASENESCENGSTISDHDYDSTFDDNVKKSNKLSAQVDELDLLLGPSEHESNVIVDPDPGFIVEEEPFGFHDIDSETLVFVTQTINSESMESKNVTNEICLAEEDIPMESVADEPEIILTTFRGESQQKEVRKEAVTGSCEESVCTAKPVLLEHSKRPFGIEHLSTESSTISSNLTVQFDETKSGRCYENQPNPEDSTTKNNSWVSLPWQTVTPPPPLQSSASVALTTTQNLDATPVQWPIRFFISAEHAPKSSFVSTQTTAPSTKVTLLPSIESATTDMPVTKTVSSSRAASATTANSYSWSQNNRKGQATPVEAIPPTDVSSSEYSNEQIKKFKRMESNQLETITSDPRSLLATDSFKYSDNIMNMFLERGCKQYQMSINMERGKRSRASTSECRVCKFPLKSSALMKHMESVHLMKANFICSRCHDKFIFRDELFHHMEKLHPQFMFEFKTNYPEVQGSQRVIHPTFITKSESQNQCNQGPRQNQSFAQIRSGIEILQRRGSQQTVSNELKMEDQKSVWCHTCKCIFKNKAFLEKHVRNVHQNAASSLTPKLAHSVMTAVDQNSVNNYYPFRCNLCEKIFKSKKDCFRHKRESHIPECKYCGKTLSRFSSLKRHEVMHEQQKVTDAYGGLLKDGTKSHNDAPAFAHHKNNIKSETCLSIDTSGSVQPFIDTTEKRELSIGGVTNLLLPDVETPDPDIDVQIKNHFDEEAEMNVLQKTEIANLSSRSFTKHENVVKCDEEKSSTHGDLLAQALRDADIDLSLPSFDDVTEKKKESLPTLKSNIEGRQCNVEDEKRDVVLSNSKDSEIVDSQIKNDSNLIIEPRPIEKEARNESNPPDCTESTTEIRVEEIQPQDGLQANINCLTVEAPRSPEKLPTVNSSEKTVMLSPKPAAEKAADDDISVHALPTKFDTIAKPQKLDKADPRKSNDIGVIVDFMKNKPDHFDEKKSKGNEVIAKKNYTCPVCSKNLGSNLNFQLHLKVEHDHESNISKEKIPAKTTLNSRQKSAQKEKHRCEDCGQLFAKKKEFQNHVKSHLRDKAASEKSTSVSAQKVCNISTDGQTFRCSTCKISFQSRPDMRCHVREMKKLESEK